MRELATFTIDNSVCTSVLDDGKANVMSVQMIAQINNALDRAQAQKAVVVITGRSGVFSGGFDLGVFKAGGPAVVEMLSGGAALAERLLSFPTPIVIACSGHAIAMGVFVLLCGDHRIGVADDSRVLRANEVAIGMTLPHFAVEVCRQRLTPACFNRATINAEAFSGQQAIAAGFLDQLAPASELLATAQAKARELAGLNMAAHLATKLRCRGATLAALRAAKDTDLADWRSTLGAIALPRA
jgi:enoyl-CoA hydratase